VTADGPNVTYASQKGRRVTLGDRPALLNASLMQGVDIVFKKWHGNPWAILITLSLGFFMTLLDLTIVNIAIPDLGADLDASLDEILWVVNAYTLALAVLLITGGRLGDLRGKRNQFATGVALFTLASLACGLAQDPPQLVAFRAVQGLGAALLMPQTLSIIAEVFPADRRGVAMGIWGTVAGVSGALGPILGGALITHLSWRWIFFVNLPLGALVLVLTATIIPAGRRTVRHRLDTFGVALASTALFCLAAGSGACSCWPACSSPRSCCTSAASRPRNPWSRSRSSATATSP
jgi:EmrB/QacA subfamily drug resistance transporter